jgi:RNA polymerase sigma-70 factor, ECF subfamily
MGRDAGFGSDASLVAAVLRNPNAYGILIARYEAVLGRYVRRLLGSHGQAVEDVMQEVFIKAYVNLNDFDAARPFAPWIYRIAHNEAMSFLRKGRSGPQVVTGEDAQLFLDRVADPDDPAQALWRSQSIANLHHSLAGLDRRYRDVLVLRYLEEKSYDEIADILQLPPGTVATYISRGLKQLRQPKPASGEVP